MINKISVLIVAALLVFASTSSVSAVSGIDGPDVIHKEANQVFTVMDLLNLYEMDVFVQTDGYTGYGNVPGEYTVVLTQGSFTKDVTVVVVKDWGNLTESNDVLFVTDYKDIYVSNDRMLTLYEIIYYIYDATGYVVTDYQFRYEELLDEYHYSFTDDEFIPEGSYELTFRLTYYSGEQSTYSALIHAIELPEMPGIILEPPPTFIEQMKTPAIVIGVVILGFYFLTHNKKFFKKIGDKL